MPWCDDCSKFWNPPQLAEGGSCPTCGRSLTKLVPAQTVGAGEVGAGEVGVAGEGGRAANLKGAPWHFKLLVVGVTGYMVYRVIWFIEWLPKHV